jgi:hypothetical protein
MNRILASIAMGGPIFVGAYALADDASPGKVSRQQAIVQIVDCVKKRVALRTVSYSDAIKACKEEVRDQSGPPAPDLLLAAGEHAKH